jgi:hypothetical protein
MTNYEKEILRKIDNKEELTQRERSSCLWRFKKEAILEGEESRFYRKMQTVFKIGERMFLIEWSKGLTEMQYNEFYEDPYEVECIEKTVIVKEWKKIEEK